jgi:hypothetical protein
MSTKTKTDVAKATAKPVTQPKPATKPESKHKPASKPKPSTKPPSTKPESSKPAPKVKRTRKSSKKVVEKAEIHRGSRVVGF